MFTDVIEKCSEWVFDNQERTIVNDVSEQKCWFVKKKFHLLCYIIKVNGNSDRKYKFRPFKTFKEFHKKITIAVPVVNFAYIQFLP